MRDTSTDSKAPLVGGSACRTETGFGGRREAAWLRVKPYAVAVVLVALMAGVRYLLDPLLGEHHPFILFLTSTLLSTWYCGWKPGVLALLLGLLTADYLFIHPRGALLPLPPEHQVGIIVYGSIGAVIISLIEGLKQAKERTEKQTIRLQTEVAEHERTQEQLRQAKAQLEQRVEERTAQLSHANHQLSAEEVARRGAEARVRRLAAIVQSSEDAVIGKDLDGIITDWNAGAEHMFGYSAAEAIGQSVSMLVLPDRRDEMDRITERLRRGEEVRPYETVRLRKGGGEIPVSIRVSPIWEDGRLVGHASINRDLTHAKQLEEQLRQSQKMEAIGQLAGGIAHDFNNLLTIINGYSEMLLSGLRADDPTRNLLQHIYDAGERAASLTHQLLAFSRKQVLQPQVVDLNQTVRNTEKMLRRLIGEDVRLTCVLDPDLGHVKVDPGQFEQVVMNLAVNARDAMPQGGKLTVETANVELDEAYAETHPEVWPGRYVLLAVSDTGTGMDEKTKAHIFEPFFTTKGAGKGTGLGLATVHGIVKQSSGHIVVYSEPDHGTAFKIYLPAVEGLRAAGKSHPGITAALKGAETVLLVEDEEQVRRLAKMALEMSGYKVLEAGHGGEGCGWPSGMTSRSTCSSPTW